MKIAVLAYNFPHKKTQDFLWTLLAHGLKPDLVLGQEWKNLGIPESTFRVRPRHIALIHPQDICQEFNIRYHVLDHESKEASSLMREIDIDIGVIAGARILSQSVIASVNKGIINFHLGIIPEHRGLDALQWSIFYDFPLGVTAHVIDETIDGGYQIEKRIINEYPDDTFIDLSIRIHETQLEMLPRAIERLDCESIKSFPLIKKGKYFRKMPPDLEKELPQKLSERIGKINRSGQYHES